MTCSIRSRLAFAIGAFLTLVVYASPLAAQGVTTASMTGVVRDTQGAVIPGAGVVAVHEPWGTTCDAVAGAAGRLLRPGMRVGGPDEVAASSRGLTTAV